MAFTMYNELWLLLLFVFILSAALSARYFLKQRALKGPLPPGPTPIPFVGNIADLPSSGELEHFHWLKHKDLYGPISSITVFGQPMIILNDGQMALDLLEKRSAKYSDRPSQTFSGELCGYGNTGGLLRYSDLWRSFRKIFHDAIGTKSTETRFHPLQEIECRRFLLRVLKHPDALLQHLRLEAASLILKMTYGYTVEPYKTDALVSLIEEMIDGIIDATSPGWTVDIFPALRYLPSWFPGGGFQRIARQRKKTLLDSMEIPFQFTKDQMARSENDPSFVSLFYEKKGQHLTPEAEHAIKISSHAIYAAGTDTTVVSLCHFFIAMSMYPEIAERAQQEIDQVTGGTRLPTFDDRKNMPYVNAIVSEVHRWQPVAPLAIPHATTQDDWYNGYHIPKGSVMIQNIWGFLHDPTTYPSPMTFDPSRFLSSPPQLDPKTFSFGLGRRICPGRLLADSSVWITIAQSLAVFNISKGRDAQGNVIEPEVRQLPGLIARPVPFKTTIQVRSQVHEELIRRAEVECPLPEGGDSELLPKAQ